MRTLVVYCNPNPESFGAAVKDRALLGLESAGHEIDLIDLYEDGFEPALTAEEHRAHVEPGVPDELCRYVEALRWAEAIVFVYPTWWSGQPALLKGWFDRVWGSGVAWELPDGSGVVRPLLGNIRRLVVVTTHGSSKLINALEGESGKRTITRSIRAMCARRVRTTWCAVYGLDRSTEIERAAFLAKVERTLADL